MKINISESTEILVFTGPESSGKTTCAELLTKRYQLPLVKEFAREYLSVHGPKYEFQDIQNIAKKQIENETISNENYPLIVCDTDWVTLEIWALEKYGNSLGVKDKLANKKHYLLCYPDIPWESDPLRENPEDRERLFERYEQYLSGMNVLYSILTEDQRKELSIAL